LTTATGRALLAAGDQAPGEQSFRERLLAGLAASIAERGYRDTTVADIVRHAKTSKRTFYAYFAGKDACLLDLLDTDNVAMIAEIRAAVNPEADWRTQIEQAVDAYLTVIAAAPAITLTWIRDFPALGDAARPVQRRGMSRFTDLLVDITASAGFRRAGLPTVTRPTALILIGGLRELTAHTLEDGEDIRGIAATAVAACTGLISAGMVAPPL
jgi:AcrR family transcriptional regulator